MIKGFPHLIVCNFLAFTFYQGMEYPHFKKFDFAADRTNSFAYWLENHDVLFENEHNNN